LSTLLLGKSIVDITPPVGLHLGGWEAERYSNSIHQPLTCRVLYLKQDKTVVVFVSLDVLGISNLYANEIREEVEKELGIPPSAVMLSATHTHSGPVLPPCLMPGVPLPDELYMADLKRKIVGAISAAKQVLTPVVVGHGKGKGDLGVSRRLPYDDGKVSFPPKADPEGAVDQEIGVLRFDSEQGKTLAVVFSYGCHPTVGGPSRWIGPDYPGQARKLVESFYGEETMAMFLLGNCADVRSNYTLPDGRFRWDTSTELIEEAGNRIGAEVIRTAVQIKTKSDVEIARSQVFKDIYMMNGEVAVNCEFQAFRIGETAMVTNPGECFAQIGLNVRKEVNIPILFSSITNGFLGYVPTKDAFPFEGYEVSLSYKYFGLASPIREDGESVFFNGMMEALKQCMEDEVTS
jgi:neutral ceramidase